MTNHKQQRCSYLCGPHLERCDLDTDAHGGSHEDICRCEKCPTRIKIKSKDCEHENIDLEINRCKSCNFQFVVCEACYVEGSMRDVLHKPPACQPGSIQFSAKALEPPEPVTNEVFDAKDIKKASSNTLPPCVECKSPDTIAVRRTDIIYAVTACLVCNHRRQMTEEEYLTEWPESS